VINACAPRLNQAVISVLALVAALTAFWPLFAILAAQLAAGLTLEDASAFPVWPTSSSCSHASARGRYEDARPNRFANLAAFP
jgi:hypothetical protein